MDALSNGKAVFVPYIQRLKGSSYVDMLALRSLDEYETLPRDKWGIPSLPSTTISDRENCFGGTGPTYRVDGGTKASDAYDGLDLIVMPGLAFDRGLNRLGHGKGYYDRFLTRYGKSIQGRPTEAMPPLGMLLAGYSMEGCS